MNVASSLTNTKRYTQPVFDSAKTPGSEKQKNKEAWVSANTCLKKEEEEKIPHLQGWKNNSEILLF